MRWLRRKERESDLERELRSHLELLAEEQRAEGLSGEAAGYAARRVLGNLGVIQEETREAWGLTWLHRFRSDVRYGFRAWRKNPGVAALVVLTAAIGIGANTSIFSIIDAVLLRPLPYADAGRLVTPLSATPEFSMAGSKRTDFGVGDYHYGAWRDQATVFDGIGAYTGRQFTITGSGDAEQLRAQVVTPGFLRTLGVAPFIGRDLTAADAAPRGGQVALLTHSFWMRKFHGDPAILAEQMTLDGKPYSIAGVLPERFEFPDVPNVSLLIGLSEPAAQPKGAVYFYNVIGRLRPGITLERAERDLGIIDGRLDAAFPQRRLRTAERSVTRVLSLNERLVGNV